MATASARVGNGDALIRRGEGDPPGRVARLSYLTGHVSLQPSGEDQWTEASTNYVVTTGDRLFADPGGRYPGLNRFLCEEVSRPGRQLLDEVGCDDKITIWKYADKPEKLADFSRARIYWSGFSSHFSLLESQHNSQDTN